MIDAPDHVARWATGFTAGVCPGVASVLDVLAGDALEEERGTRPDGVLVEADAGARSGRMEAEAFSSWTFGYPTEPGPVARAAWATGLWPVKWIDRRLRALANEADARQVAFEGSRADLGTIPWKEVADMEVVSLAMGHFGPSRQAPVVAVAGAAMFSRAAAVSAAHYYNRINGMARDRLHALTELAESTSRHYDDSFRAIAETSAEAFTELARRATERGVHVADPFAIHVRAYVKLLAVTSKRA